MRKSLIVVLILVAAALLTAVGASARNCSIYNATAVSQVVTPSATPEETAMPAAAETPSPVEYRKITAEEAKARMDSGDSVVIVDVRTPEEFTSGHIPGAINVPNEGILDQIPEGLPDPDAEILVYCRSGRRSKEAANKLIEIGYTNVYDFGGIIDWPYDVEAQRRMTGEFAVAVHALVFLHKCDGVKDSEALARNICTNPARVRKVMAKLRQAGLVEARPGAEGGYRFILNPDDVSLRRIAEALNERPVAACWRSGDPENSCMVSSGMAKAMDEVYDELNRICLDRLSGSTLADVEAQLISSEPCQNHR